MKNDARVNHHDGPLALTLNRE